MIFADILSRFPSRKENQPIQLHKHIDQIYLWNSCLYIIQGSIDRDPIYQTSLLTHPQWMACKIPYSSLHSQTVVGSLGQTIHWQWTALEKLTAMHPTYIRWEMPQWPTWRICRNRKDVAQWLTLSLLVWDRCWHHQPYEVVPSMHPA